jgi:glycosyltransferase involved in cell wall biosynthesis
LGVKILDAHIAPRLLSWQRGRFPRGFPAAELVNSAAGLATVLGLDKPTVIYTHSQKAHLLGGLAGRLAGVPVVWHAREVLGGPALRLLMSAMSRACPRRIICVSKAVAEQFPRVPGKVSVVPNGVDASEVRRLASLSAGKSTRSRLGLQASAPLLGMVSRIAPGKGQHVFIEAASLVSKRYPGTGFIIIGGTLFGEEPYLQELRRRAGSLGLGGMIHFTGHLENPLPAMRELDVLVHCPVVPEGFGRSVAEAMALGVPVVSVRGGGIPELIDDGVKGLLAEPGDARGLATAIGRLLSDRALAGRLALAAREKIETRFTMEAAMAAIERTLLEV